MAEEVKKIITIEVGKSITSIRDFKKHIEDLRGSLLTLNKDSDEYKTIAAEIAQSQEKLNEVMKIGKTSTDAASGSYIELNNQLKSLRNQYKALSEADREGAIGKNMLVSIQQLDTKLKDLDEGMGVYNRNVGNYKQAFEEAFKAVAANIGNVNPELGKLMQTASSLIPLIKAASNAATTGLKGIKAGIASTGIGLLIVALGEIVANWEKISGWVNKVLGNQQKLTTETKSTATAASNLADQLERAGRIRLNIQDIWGLTDFEKAEEDLKDLKNQIEEMRLASRSISITRRELRNFSDAYHLNYYETVPDEIRKAAIRQLDYYLKDSVGKEALKRINEALGDNKISKSVLTQLQIGLQSNSARMILRSANELDSIFKEAGKIIEEGQAELNNQYKKANDNYEEQKILDTERAKKRAADLKKVNQSRLEQLREEFETEANWLKKALAGEPKEVLDEALNNLQKEYRQKVKEILGDSVDIRKEEALNLFNSLKDYGKTELEVLEEEFQKNLKLLNDYGLDTTALIEKYKQERQAILDREAQETLEKERQAQEELLRQQREYYDKRLDYQIRAEDQVISAVSTRMINGKTTTGDTPSDIANERAKEDEIFNIQKAGYEARIQIHQDYLMQLEDGDEARLDVLKEIAEEEMGLAELVYNHTADLEERKRKDLEETLRIAQGMIQAYGNLGAGIAGIIADASEEGSAKWKAARISETVISTIAGAAGAFMQGMSSYPMPWGAAIGAAGAALATATGIAEIAKIKNTNMSSSSSSVSSISASSSMGASVSPLLNPDYDLQRITNLSLQSDAYLPGNTQVYVLESDIQEVGNRVKVREQNATF